MSLTATQFLGLPQCHSSTGNTQALISTAGDLEQRSSGHSACNHITVKESARRLGVSPGRIYRMNRIDGPFPIFKSGWRGWVDLDGFESFMAAQLGDLAPLDSEPPGMTGFNEGHASHCTDDQQGSLTECTFPAATTDVPAADLPGI